MARDAALVTTWGNAVRGREAKALEVFMEFMQWWGKQAAQGKCSEPEAFFASDGYGGMSIVRGKSDVLMELSSSEEALRLISKGQLIVEDLKTHWYYTGQDEITGLTSMFLESGHELGYV
jgi:hypothetical protein